MLEQVGARANASSRMLVRMRPNITEERSPSSSSYIWHCVHTCRAPVQTLPNCCSERCARARVSAHKRTAHTARSRERASARVRHVPVSRALSRTECWASL